MVSIYGLNDTLGNITYYDSSGQTDFNFSNLIQSKPLKLSIKRFQKLLKNSIIEQLPFKNSKDKLKKLADRLLEKE